MSPKCSGELSALVLPPMVGAHTDSIVLCSALLWLFLENLAQFADRTVLAIRHPSSVPCHWRSRLNRRGRPRLDWLQISHPMYCHPNLSTNGERFDVYSFRTPA